MQGHPFRTLFMTGNMFLLEIFLEGKISRKLPGIVSAKNFSKRKIAVPISTGGTSGCPLALSVLQPCQNLSNYYSRYTVYKDHTGISTNTGQLSKVNVLTIMMIQAHNRHKL